MRTWHDDKWPMVEDDASHKRRGSLGGEDYGVAAGSPLYAPATGTLRARNGGTGGNTLSLNPDGYDDIVAIEVMHCSGLGGLQIGGSSIRVTEGQLVGKSGGVKGAPGAGNSTGPHTHEHIDLSNGTRTGITLYMQEHGGSAAKPGTSTKPTLEEAMSAFGGAVAHIHSNNSVAKPGDPNYNQALVWVQPGSVAKLITEAEAAELFKLTGQTRDNLPDFEQAQIDLIGNVLTR